MSAERLIEVDNNIQYSDHLTRSCSSSSVQCKAAEHPRIFEELPKATIVSVSRPDSPLSFTTNRHPLFSLLFLFHFKWHFVKKASQVLYLHSAVKKRVIIHEFHEKQEQVKEWLQSLGIVDQVVVCKMTMNQMMEPYLCTTKKVVKVGDYSLCISLLIEKLHQVYDFIRNSYKLVCYAVMLDLMLTISDRAKVVMQGYLNHFLGNIDIVNSREVCKFFEVSRLSFAQKYGPKVKEGYVMVKHLSKISRAVSCGNQSIKFRSTCKGKVKHWVAAINDAGLRPLEGWCHPHCFASFAPPRGLIEDGSQVQRFIDGQAAFRAITSSIKDAKSEGGINGGGVATVRALMHWQYWTISRETSILHNLNMLLGPKTQDYITFSCLRSYGRLCNGGPVATSQVYVHSKVMIIDSCAAFFGSSNINDRSLLGSRDPEGCSQTKPNQRKEKLWHSMIDLGIASEKLETYENGETKTMWRPKKTKTKAGAAAEGDEDEGRGGKENERLKKERERKKSGFQREEALEERKHLSVPVAGDSPHVYNTTETIFLYCGSSENIPSQDGTRTWIGDIKSEHFPLHQSQNNASTPAKLSKQPRHAGDETPYMRARFSRYQFSYTFNLTPGPKFIRLHFYETSYQNLDRSKAFFSVTAGSFTLLSNFSTSLAANFSGQDTISKEFCVNVQENQILNITFSPTQDYKDSYAFINGIEIVSMPPDLYYTTELPLVGQAPGATISVSNSNALEMVYRLNVGGYYIAAGNDTGMYRTWSVDDNWFQLDYPGAIPVNLSLKPSFRVIPNYSAPIEVYQTARTMGNNAKMNEKYWLTWEFPVDSVFTYLVRLHFCEFQPEITVYGNRVFQINIADQIAEKKADVIGWSGGNGVPVYKDYAVMMGPKANQKKQNLSIALHPAPAYMTNYSDAILNGVEIFKIDNSGSLAGPNPDPGTTPTTVAPPTSSNNRSSNRKIIISVVVGVVSILIAVSVVLLFIRRRKISKVNEYSGSHIAEKSRQFSLSEMKAATNNFDKVFIIGVGGFGNVYKGFINGASGSGTTQVAIKRLNPGSQQGAHEFKTEIEMLSQLRYLHLVSLIGYCNDDGEMILIYDYMPRGTLRDHLYGSNNPPLSWSQRLQICIGAGRGLNYLHTGAKQVIIHRDVKTTNILLDEKWVAKVSDFGLSKVGPTSTMSKAHVSTAVKGSFGYLDPEYIRFQRLTEKSDVYSFGVVLCEVMCAREPIIRTVDKIHKKQGNLAGWARQCYDQNGTLDQIVDPVLKGKIAPQCLKKFCDVAMNCLDDEGIKRPSMSDVVWGLEFALQLQQEYDKLSGGAGNGICVPHLDDDQTLIKNYTYDYDSSTMFSRIGGHVLESRTMTTMTNSSSDDYGFSSKDSDSKPMLI
ncbi:hypothetical protein LWI28_007956 [Acer negundo]|uniref:Receptor-like protein kinase FERONIA n=1 Tax=Acer negundo TaxID=4023 RepID=A0AAD5J4S5_ACENE|nr:hypothetical protein LWI28_007956 [Acer negundo]